MQQLGRSNLASMHSIWLYLLNASPLHWGRCSNAGITQCQRNAYASHSPASLHASNLCQGNEDLVFCKISDCLGALDQAWHSQSHVCCLPGIDVLLLVASFAPGMRPGTKGNRLQASLSCKAARLLAGVSEGGTGFRRQPEGPDLQCLVLSACCSMPD